MSYDDRIEIVDRGLGVTVTAKICEPLVVYHSQIEVTCDQCEDTESPLIYRADSVRSPEVLEGMKQHLLCHVMFREIAQDRRTT